MALRRAAPGVFARIEAGNQRIRRHADPITVRVNKSLDQELRLGGLVFRRYSLGLVIDRRLQAVPQDIRLDLARAVLLHDPRDLPGRREVNMPDIQKRVLFFRRLIEDGTVPHGHRGVKNNLPFFFSLLYKALRLSIGKIELHDRHQWKKSGQDQALQESCPDPIRHIPVLGFLEQFGPLPCDFQIPNARLLTTTGTKLSPGTISPTSMKSSSEREISSTHGIPKSGARISPTIRPTFWPNTSKLGRSAFGIDARAARIPRASSCVTP